MAEKPSPPLSTTEDKTEVETQAPVLAKHPILNIQMPTTSFETSNTSVSAVAPPTPEVQAKPTQS